MIADTGYQGLQKIHNRTEFPKKRRKKIKINHRRQDGLYSTKWLKF